MNDIKRLAIIVPCFNEQEVLPSTNGVLLGILERMIYDKLVTEDSYICYVNDGSNDKTWEIILNYIKTNSLVKGISFSRNYGHQSAMLAGLSTCDADIYITIDADLQDEPNVIIEMIKKYYGGVDIVYGVRKSRSVDSFFKRNTAKLFYKLMKFFGSQTIENSAEYRLISRRIVDHIRNNYKEKNLYLRGIITHIGYKYDTVSYDRRVRQAGETKYTLSKMLMTAVNGLVISSTNLFNIVLFFSLFMFFITLLSFLLLMFSVILDFYSLGYFLIFFISFIGTVNLFTMYIMAEYINRIYIEVRERPLYIISEDYTK